MLVFLLHSLYRPFSQPKIDELFCFVLTIDQLGLLFVERELLCVVKIALLSPIFCLISPVIRNKCTQTSFFSITFNACFFVSVFCCLFSLIVFFYLILFHSISIFFFSSKFGFKFSSSSVKHQVFFPLFVCLFYEPQYGHFQLNTAFVMA